MELKYQPIITPIREAEALGLIPNIPNNISDEDINTLIDQLYLQPTEDAEFLRKQEQLQRLIDAFDQKGIMDEIYPQGYKFTRRKIFKKRV